MVFFILSIMSFVWRTGSILDPEERPALSPRAALAPRIAVTVLFFIGMIYFMLIVKTLKSYGSSGPGWKPQSAQSSVPVETDKGRRDRQEPTRGRPVERSIHSVRTRERAHSHSDILFPASRWDQRHHRATMTSDDVNDSEKR